MVRLTVELEDEMFASLRAKAERLGISVEAVVAAAASREAVLDDGVTSEFLADVDDMIETYRPVLHRLAQ